MRRLLCMVLLLSAASCLRGGEERAHLDERAGRGQTSSLTLTVAQGNASVKRLEPGYAQLWLGAPFQSLTFEFAAGAERTWQLDLQNAMPALTTLCLSASGQRCEAHIIPGEIPTEKKLFLFFGDEEHYTVTLAPPEADLAAPFSFILFSDVQEELPRVQDAYTLMNTFPEAQFVISAGDLTDNGEEAQLIEYQRRMRDLNIPQYVTPGNHDTFDTTDKDWHTLFGRHSHSFTFRETRFTFVDSAAATVDPIVYGWLKRWLDEGRDQLHIFTTHIPIIDPDGFRNGSFRSRQEAHKILAMLAQGEVDLTLYGHVHTYLHFTNGGIEAIISGGGGGWPERLDNIGRHFVLFTADPATQQITHEVIRID